MYEIIVYKLLADRFSFIASLLVAEKRSANIIFQLVKEQMNDNIHFSFISCYSCIIRW